ncbi:2-hydroxyacyl-CoA dehydratase subunit D [Desulfitobacterium chlororespirans]|uniref:Benzoyl-CoA reductase/2-hydroxyglutaryl-CoA dehydratase subunit, BcrC/BadD/HgdB n=1 Tax=Desulfitobacterium chlororespirans DSM 11544 TaxID=1121395 RepID=A0A1M7U5V7_9FIRM|nr:2-hydroxyacyl-CoA dehydratase family protein [Desulfitobacterium chlororespirans]SHN78285.1 Benzoyl-CoA reductase/2-hydroxyglutaryl-CoA dehydratase subunit, BcrC/BadD/HgdB [Desulfitobacterium chlororespirans DSM 11544]
MMEWSVPEEKRDSLSLLLEESALKGSKRKTRYPNHRFLGILCSYFPEELIMAFGLEPLRLLPDSAQRTPAELPPFSCSLARGILDMELQGRWEDLLGVGFVHTCDTMQCLSGIWEFAGKQNIINMVPPVMLKAAGANQYYQEEAKRAWEQLQRLTGHEPTEESLREAIRLCRRIREKVNEVEELRGKLPSPLTAALLRAGQLMPRAIYAEVLDEVLPELYARAEESGSRARLMVTGAVLENDHLYAMIEELGGRVVVDDTCTGYRHYSGPPMEESSDPWYDLVKRYEDMPPCPCKNQSLNARLEYLGNLASRRQVEGAVLVIRKYCEPHAWDAVPLAETLQNRGVRTLVLELEGADVGGQERTRLQAFLESILENRSSDSEGRAQA